MRNRKLNTRNTLDIFLSHREYWDFYLSNNQEDIFYRDTEEGIIDDCLVIHYDFDEPSIYESGDTKNIYSLTTWDDATNSGLTLNNIGLTGIDNGLVTYDKMSGDTANQNLLNALTGSTLILPNDNRMIMHKITGMTGNYVYGVNTLNDENPNIGEYSQLCGGFYQGFYKLEGYNYEVIPNRVPKAWVAEVWLKKDDDVICSGGTSGKTLNDDYENNKGFFLYFGTRAENKFWNQFEGLNTGCTSGCTNDSGCSETVTDFCTIPKEINISLSGNPPIPLNPPKLEITEITNPFLIYHRGSGTNCSGEKTTKGETACSYNGNPIIVTGYTEEIIDNRNPFLIYHRGSGTNCVGEKTTKGETVCSYSGNSRPITELDYKLDIIDNAIGFRIKDDGSIGYRMLTLSGVCVDDIYVTGVTVEEKYSEPNMIKEKEWTKVSIRWVANNEYDDCDLKNGKRRKGRLMFYVDCRLKFIVRDFPEFITRSLNEHPDKQLGVPYNISLGGGTQGLLESMTFDGQDPSDIGLEIEENFAGTFIGGISQFRFYICDLNWCDLKFNCEIEDERYNG